MAAIERTLDNTKHMEIKLEVMHITVTVVCQRKTASTFVRYSVFVMLLFIVMIQPIRNSLWPVRALSVTFPIVACNRTMLQRCTHSKHVACHFFVSTYSARYFGGLLARTDLRMAVEMNLLFTLPNSTAASSIGRVSAFGIG